jgi:hypothetical protein
LKGSGIIDESGSLQGNVAAKVLSNDPSRLSLADMIQVTPNLNRLAQSAACVPFAPILAEIDLGVAGIVGVWLQWEKITYFIISNLH